MFAQWGGVGGFGVVVDEWGEGDIDVNDPKSICEEMFYVASFVYKWLPISFPSSVFTLF